MDNKTKLAYSTLNELNGKEWKKVTQRKKASLNLIPCKFTLVDETTDAKFSKSRIAIVTKTGNWKDKERDVKAP